MPRSKRSWTKFDVLLGDLDVLAHHRELHLQRAQIEIGAGDVGDDRDQHHVAGGDRRLHVVPRRLDRAPELAENVDLPSGVEADNVDDLRYADAGLGGYERRRGAAAREIAAGSPAAAGAGFERRQRRADEDGLLRPRLLQPIERDLQVGLAAMARSISELSSPSCSARHHLAGSTARPSPFASGAAAKVCGIGGSGG